MSRCCSASSRAPSLRRSLASCISRRSPQRHGPRSYCRCISGCRNFNSSRSSQCIVMIVVMIESLGMFLALGEITGKAVSRDALTRGLRADGVGTLLGGLFNTFPYTSFSQNVGLVGITGVRSRWVTVTGGAIMLLLGLLPKMAALVEAVPLVVLGGAGLVMFGMVAATGARILTSVDFRNNRYNLFIVAISVGFGMI